MKILTEPGHGGTAQGESQGRLTVREHTLTVVLILPTGPGEDSPKEHMVRLDLWLCLGAEGQYWAWIWGDSSSQHAHGVTSSWALA